MQKLILIIITTFFSLTFLTSCQWKINNSSIFENKNYNKKEFIVENWVKGTEVLYLVLGNKKIKIKEISDTRLSQFKNIEIIKDLLVYEIKTIWGHNIFVYSISDKKKIYEAWYAKLTNKKDYIYYCITWEIAWPVNVFNLESKKRQVFEEEWKYVSFCKYDEEKNKLFFTIKDEKEEITKSYNFESGKLEVLKEIEKVKINVTNFQEWIHEEQIQKSEYFYNERNEVFYFWTRAGKIDYEWLYLDDFTVDSEGFWYTKKCQFSEWQIIIPQTGIIYSDYNWDIMNCYSLIRAWIKYYIKAGKELDYSFINQCEQTSINVPKSFKNNYKNLKDCSITIKNTDKL